MLGWDYIWAKLPHRFGLCPECTIRFFFGGGAKSALKLRCTKMFFRQKLLQITICNFWYKIVFDRPMDLASALIAQFVFLFFCFWWGGGGGRKMPWKCIVQKIFQTKVVTNQKPQLLCYVTLFDIFSHFGVMEASQVCIVCRESIVLSHGTHLSFLHFCPLWTN